VRHFPHLRHGNVDFIEDIILEGHIFQSDICRIVARKIVGAAITVCRNVGKLLCVIQLQKLPNVPFKKDELPHDC
jgi:hypothetical protein